ncbi:efflux transporter outer membrane subunit [Novosphingobium terrae]|uniref:efflux transporter outer membrane subunit n=1 Tax=Novosphingobium terrae TaxID=2726189 RepID=UPI00197D1391|nr:efflux transporter outer membrane subunit [Novosphingobium terrae]
MAKRLLAGLALLAATSLGACSQVPAYHPPVAPNPPAFREGGPWSMATPSSLSEAGHWWEGFGDPVLNELEGRIEKDSPTLAAALARRDQATAALRGARADLFPQLNANSNLTYDRQSQDRPLRSLNQENIYGNNTLGGTASYELDLWGRVRAEVAAGRANALASQDDVAAVRLSLQADLAAYYITLRGLDREADLLVHTVAAYQQADDVTQHRFKGGIATGIETGQSGAQLADAQAQLADVQASRAKVEHAIATLVGAPASELTLAASITPLNALSADVGLPSTLLQRRPDIAAAERRMFAANEGIGQARAAAFPQISLLGGGGTNSTVLSGLGSAPNLFWALGPSISLPLFDGGRIKAGVARARAQWNESTATYRLTVLTAFQQVEDSLSDLHHLGDEDAAEHRAVANAEQAAQLSMNRYNKGASSYLDVVTAQTTELTARRKALQVETARLRAGVALVRALGGGWQKA